MPGVVVALQDEVPVFRSGEWGIGGSGCIAQSLEKLEQVGYGSSVEPCAVGWLALLVIENGKSAEAGDDAVGDSFFHQINVGDFTFQVVAPHRAWDAPLGDICVLRGFFRRLRLRGGAVGADGEDEGTQQRKGTERSNAHIFLSLLSPQRGGLRVLRFPWISGPTRGRIRKVEDRRSVGRSVHPGRSGGATGGILWAGD